MLLQEVTPWDIVTTVLDILLHYDGPYYVTDMVVADIMRNILIVFFLLPVTYLQLHTWRSVCSRDCLIAFIIMTI